MARYLRLFAALLGVFVVHLVAVRLWPDFQRYVDLMIIILVINALDGDTLKGALGGMLCGLVTDYLLGSYYGLHGVVGTVLGYGVARTAQQLTTQSRLVLALIFVLTASLQQAMVAGLLFLIAADPPIPEPVLLLIKSIASGILGLFLLFVARALMRRWNRRRGRRVTKVRL